LSIWAAPVTVPQRMTMQKTSSWRACIEVSCLSGGLTAG
jgi:hypothetical protein